MYMWRDIKNPTAGGAGRTTHELCKRWAQKGHKVTVFTSAFPRGKEKEVIDGYEIVRKGSLLTHYFYAYVYYKRYFKGQYDVVIDQINTIPYFSPLYVRDANIVVFIHQLCREIWFYESRFPISLFGYLMEPLYLRLYKKYPTITVSESTRKDLSDLGFSNVIISYNSAVASLYKPTEKKEKYPTILFVGRLKKAKRPDHLIKAVHLIKKDIPNIKLWIVGEGDFKGALVKLTKKYHLEDNVVFWGLVSTERKSELMQKAHCICVTSVREGWGLIVTEANAMGTPAIVYNVPGLRDSVKEGINGLITPKNTPQSLAITLTNFFRDENLMNKLSLNARRDALNYSWDKSANVCLRFIGEVCEKQ
ncbi:MAG: glycosyltransferase family 1 protein [Deltaproteobacteria bacterium]|nr:MAG: glycosyltransferase family 1 protein [Deltaproteobacteria bacterium]